ncbi:MAG: IS110 family transposase [Coriobacteriia bacterium]|nr:IS110 family transposase [Coriobacteriia bacterium]
MKTYDVNAGVDVGKSFHHIYAIGHSGEVLADRRINQCEQELTDTFTELLSFGSVLVTVDQPSNIGSLTIACARRAGCDVAYLPGLAMRRAAGIMPGEAKTDRRDAFVIAMTASSLPGALRRVPDRSGIKADLAALASYDDDCRCDMTREINRLRAHLLEVSPLFERTLGDSVTSSFALKLLNRFGGPWGMHKAGKAAVIRWAKKQKRVPRKLFDRLIEAAFSKQEMPAGACLREELAIPACASRILELIAVRKDIERRVIELLSDDPGYIALITIPGVGVRTAMTFLLCVDIAAFPSVDHLASYAGLAPRTHQSGTSIKGESAARTGNKALKNALYQSAFAALRSDPHAKWYYDKKRAEGKTHNAALIALARRRLKIMYAIVRDLRPYQTVA